MVIYNVFKHVILIAKRYKKNTALTLIALRQYLINRNISVFVAHETAVLCKLALKKSDLIQDNAFCQLEKALIIVVGGDGSLLNLAPIAAEQNLPVLGINRGRLGFLTDISPRAFDNILAILQGSYQEESRFLLETSVFRKENKIYQHTALNDAVVSPGTLSQMIEFSIMINHALMCAQRADGLIIATPTGSTAYALSGGGPILHPQLDAIVLVPMFPHKLTSRPIVISGNAQIEITFLNTRKIKSLPYLNCDGQSGILLDKNDRICIQKSTKTFKLIHPLNYQYFSTLRAKLHWEDK